MVGTGKLDLNFAKEGPVYAGRDWGDLKKKQPFFAQINMPEAEYDIYDRKSAEKPRVKWVGEEWHPKVATPENVTPPPYYPDHKITREEWARYLNSITGTDVRIGWILDQLKKDGLSENTIVVFFADNGRLDARGIHWCWDSGLHVPMIIRWPKRVTAPAQVAPGRVDEQVLSLLDLSATTLWMAGIPKPFGMQSRVLLGADAEPARTYAFAARGRTDETEVRQRSLHDAHFHYIRNYTPGAGFLPLAGRRWRASGVATCGCRCNRYQIRVTVSGCAEAGGGGAVLAEIIRGESVHWPDGRDGLLPFPCDTAGQFLWLVRLRLSPQPLLLLSGTREISPRRKKLNQYLCFQSLPE